MRNIRLAIEYDGTNYCGWQVQNKRKSKEKTIQEALEKALSRILQEKVKVIGSGRTDSGVHALGQAANFKSKSNLSCQNIQKALNSILPRDIRIKPVKEVPLGFHARFSAQSKLYRYTIVNGSFVSPFLRRYSYLVKHPLNMAKMRKGARYLLGRHNFRSFQAVEKKERAATRTIKRLDIHKEDNLIYLNIEADGFLYKMVRNIAGTLIEVGRGKLKPQDVKRILRAKNRIYAGPCAPAKGLCLMEVKYKRGVIK
ncbi:MAG: tRNA pseudouridine(38-40) synthase TruA [Candidatus Omnitrophica bacterium]|nr:tRNA pseudouridine(38-40) synthase TruA [Candidatus Omnitrophota bacterium]